MIGSNKYYNEEERDKSKESWLSFRQRTQPLRDREGKETEANAKPNCCCT